MNIVFYGGSFNPFHNGHLALAQSIIDQQLGDKVLISVTPQNPLKQTTELASDEMRQAMVRLALEERRDIELTDIEQNLPKPCYTIHTLKALQQQYPDDRITLLIGGDNAQILHKWYAYEEILDNFTVLVYPRPEADTSTIIKHKNIKFINAPLYDISSTEIRERIKNNRSCEGLISQKVELFILNNKLYL